jgi:hypothetical protein
MTSGGNVKMEHNVWYHDLLNTRVTSKRNGVI